jgi:signal peptidase II
MKLIKENYQFFILILLLFSIDRITKIKILDILQNKNFIFVNDFLNLTLVFNTGIGFGLLSFDEIIYYNLITLFILLIILILFVYMLKSSNREKLFFSLIIGGAIGNLYDRFFFQAVPDFIDFHFGEYHWFTFNIADIFI